MINFIVSTKIIINKDLQCEGKHILLTIQEFDEVTTLKIAEAQLIA